MANELENTANVENSETKPDTDSAELDKRIKQLESENAKLKQSVTNASADASEWKRKYQATMTDAERANADREAATAAMQAELEALRNERNVANHTAQFVSLGFDEPLAKETAEALNSGDTDKLFAGIRKFIVSHDKQITAQNLLKNPTLQGGEPTKKAVTREEFNKMGYREMLAFKQEHPELYAEYKK